jgi:hypothetical protein
VRAGEGIQPRTISLGMSLTAAQTSQIAGQVSSRLAATDRECPQATCRSGTQRARGHIAANLLIRRLRHRRRLPGTWRPNCSNTSYWLVSLFSVARCYPARIRPTLLRLPLRPRLGISARPSNYGHAEQAVPSGAEPLMMSAKAGQAQRFAVTVDAGVCGWASRNSPYIMLSRHGGVWCRG